MCFGATELMQRIFICGEIQTLTADRIINLVMYGSSFCVIRPLQTGKNSLVFSTPCTCV